MRSVRILIVHNAYQLQGGEDTVVDSELALLRSHGHDVEIYTRKNSEIVRMSSFAVARQTLWSDRTTHEISTLLSRFRPDVIHSHNTFPLVSPSLYWVAAHAKVPVVQTLHNFRLMCLNALYLRESEICEECLGRAPWRGVMHRCYRSSFSASAVLGGMLSLHRALGTYRKKISRYIALNSFCRNKFIAAGFSKEKINVKPNFYNPSILVDTGQTERSNALFVGRLSREKGVVTLLKAWHELHVPLRIVGDGPFMTLFFKENNPRVELLGRISRQQVSVTMGRSTFLVVPSECYENFPMVLVEAFAHGLPVVASRLGAMAEIVEDGYTGLHFEPGNAQDLAQKVQWLYDHPVECRQMGDNARREYEAKYTPERNYQILMKIYEEAIEERRRDRRLKEARSEKR